MFDYVHPLVQFVDIRTLPNPDPKVYQNRCFTHQTLFHTDKPKCLELKDAHASNPYHLLFYMMARFFFFDNGTNTLRYFYKKTDCYLGEQALKCLPARFQRITEKQEEEEYIEFPGFAWGHDFITEPWIYAYVRDLYKHIWEPIPQTKGKRVFISRKSAFQRVLNQEKDLVGPMKQKGFSFYELEMLTFEDQIRLFRSAECIVSPHGAGLSWMIFCHPNTLICEINGDFPGKNHYLDIAQKLQLPYYRFNQCAWEKETENMNIETEPFLKAMDELLQKIQ